MYSAESNTFPCFYEMLVHNEMLFSSYEWLSYGVKLLLL